MSAVDAAGYLASLLVLLTFCMRGMVSLRVLAIASNVAFIVYAGALGLLPVLLLHGLLLPLNLWRMRELTRTAQVRPACDPMARAGRMPIGTQRRGARPVAPMAGLGHSPRSSGRPHRWTTVRAAQRSPDFTRKQET